jgi:CDP-glucose 4,6-dehydratase
MNAAFWKDKRVFLTGGTGFKGSWLALWLQEMGAKVTGFSLEPNTTPSLFEVASVGEGMESHIGDIRNFEELSAAVKAAMPEIVIHMAAQPLVRESYDNPVFNYATNVMGTVHLLEAVRHTPGVKSVVIVTSDKCYENREWHWAYREESTLGGDDPYSNSKACSELVTSSYRTSFFNPARFQEHGVAVASARAGNVIGGGDWAKDRLVPDALAALQAGNPLVLRNPNSTRPWQHVLEPLNGYLVLAEALYNEGPRHAEAWNFGPYEFSDRTVGWIVDRLCGLWGLDIPKHPHSGPQPHEAGYLKVDSSKARALLGWSPKLDLEVTLQWIVDWTKVHQGGGDVKTVTLSQIRRFASLPAYSPGVPNALAASI